MMICYLYYTCTIVMDGHDEKNFRPRTTPAPATTTRSKEISQGALFTEGFWLCSISMSYT